MAEEKKAKTKKPTALKRDLQNTKKRLRNREFKSGVRTQIKKFQESCVKGDKETSALLLKEVYSLLDKGVKNGTYKLNTASRTKSRLAAKAAA